MYIFVLSQLGTSAEPFQQQQCTSKQQIGWQPRYTGRLKGGEKRASKPLCQKQSKRKKKDKEDEIKVLKFKQRCGWIERLKSATFVWQYLLRETQSVYRKSNGCI